MRDLSRRDVFRLAAAGIAAGAAIDLTTACGAASHASTSDPNALEPFAPKDQSSKRTGLPGRVAWASTADSEFFLALGSGMRMAAGERGVEYVTATSGNDPTKHVEQMRGFLAQGVGSLAVQPLSPDAEAPVLAEAIAKGVCAQGIITGPSTLQVVASQYQIGFDQGKAAADYVTAHLGGNAQVIYFNLDSASPQLQLRHHGVLDGLRTGGGGIEVVSDLTVADISTASGFNTMLSALQTHQDVKVVLGGDTIVVGAFRALRDSGKLTDDMFLSGVDGDKEALDLVRAGGAYKLSIAFAWTLMGYGLGRFGADWIEGKDVPRLIHAKGVHLDSVDAIDRFAAASTDPTSAFADRARWDEYLPLYGSVSHAEHTSWKTPVDPPAGRGMPTPPATG